jgi:hypothetical protein
MKPARKSSFQPALRHLFQILTEAFTKNWGLKILALLLALVIYHSLKPEAGRAYKDNNDKRIFSY